jgi:hypothetical protein
VGNFVVTIKIFMYVPKPSMNDQGIFLGSEIRLESIAQGNIHISWRTTMSTIR